MCSSMEHSSTLIHTNGEAQEGQVVPADGAPGGVDNVLPLGLAAAGAAPGPDGLHPNVFVRGLPLAWNEAEISAVFQQYGQLSSLRLVRHSVTKHSLGYGFVRFQNVGEAQAAINALDGTSVLGHALQVKYADADAGPPSTAAPSGLTPSDSCYVKHLPAMYGVQEVQQLFEVHGAVLDVKLFPCLDQFRGTSALVRMATVEAAERAITALNNATPLGAVQSLIVRYAESAVEKAARLTRRERQYMQRTGMQSPPDGQYGGLGGLSILPPEQQLQQALSALNLQGVSGLPLANNGGGAPGLLPGARPAPSVAPAPLIQQQFQPPVLSSVCVKGMPSAADRLWLYENFARFGGISGLRILTDEVSGLCNGTGFVNYADAQAAEKARQVMNGMRAGDKILHVMVQYSGRHGLNPGSSNMGPAPSSGSNSSQAYQTQHEWQMLQQPASTMLW